MVIHSHKDLDVWKKAMSLVTNIYALTKHFPKDELYGLTSQIRRAAVSIPSNIAEGRSKRSTREFMRFLNIAIGSAAELETQLMIGQNLGYMDENQLRTILDDLSNIARMMNGIHASLERKIP